MTSNETSDERVVAAVSYFGIFSVIIYLIYRSRPSRFVRFHSLQAMMLFACIIFLDVCLTITIIGILLLPIVFFATLIGWIILAYNAYSGRMTKLPVIGEIALKHS